MNNSRIAGTICEACNEAVESTNDKGRCYQCWYHNVPIGSKSKQDCDLCAHGIDIHDDCDDCDDCDYGD